MSKTNKWKDALLRTSLPLEHVVAERLCKNNLDLWGEFSFIRENEQGVSTEFSVDLRAVELLSRGGRYWASLNLLVECKYSYPSVKWVFAPHPEESLVVTGVINKFQDLCTRRLTNTSVIYDLDNTLEFCVKGIELHESDSNTQSIERGLNQLRWALPQLASELLTSQATTLHDEDLHIEFMCPILVTTAPLYVLRRGLRLNKFHSASQLEDVAHQVDALIIYKERGPQLNQFLKKVQHELHETPGLDARLESLWEIVRTPEERLRLSPNWDFDQYMSFIAERILVVNLNAFEPVISTIRKAIKASGKGLRRIAKLRPEIDKRVGRIEAS